MFKTLLQVCLTEVPIKPVENVTRNIIKRMNLIAPRMFGTLMVCVFRNEQHHCNEQFKHVITEEGICYTFNMLNSNELYRDR